MFAPSTWVACAKMFRSRPAVQPLARRFNCMSFGTISRIPPCALCGPSLVPEWSSFRCYGCQLESCIAFCLLSKSPQCGRVRSNVHPQFHTIVGPGPVLTKFGTTPVETPPPHVGLGLKHASSNSNDFDPMLADLCQRSAFLMKEFDRLTG